MGDGEVHELSFPRGEANRGGIIADRVSSVETRKETPKGRSRFPPSRKLPEIAAYAAGFFRNIARGAALATGRATGAG